MVLAAAFVESVIHKPAPDHTKRLIRPHETNLPLTVLSTGRYPSPFPFVSYIRPVPSRVPGEEKAQMATDRLTRLRLFIHVLALVGGLSVPPALVEAGTPTLVRDVASGSETLASSAQQFVRAGNDAYFTAYDPDEGWELWRTNGTPEATRRVTSIVDGPGPMPPVTERIWLAALGETVLFTAWDPAHGLELWKTDSSGSVTLVKDIAPGPIDSQPGPLTVAGGQVFFSAWEPATGAELWVTDGTESGTHLVEDELPGPASVHPIYLSAVGARVFYAGASTSNRWRASDGTPAGTGPFEGEEWYMAGPPAEYDRALYFQACAKNPAGSDCELWSSPDGTMASSRRTADIAPGAASSKPLYLVASANGLLFGADASGGYSSWLWRYDGQEAEPVGTYTCGGSARVGDTVYFYGGASGLAVGLHKTDGTADGTTLVEVSAGLPWGSLSGAPIYRTSAWDPTLQAWRSFLKTPGVPQGTLTLLEIEYSTGAVFGGGVELDGRWVFGIDRAGDQSENLEPWVTDGTVAGTQLLKDIRTEAPGSSPGRAASLAVAGQVQTFFPACETTYSCLLWKTDGANTAPVPLAPETSLYYPSNLVAFGDRIYFLAGSSSWKLYWTDGSGTHLFEVPGSSGAPSYPPIVAGSFLYVAYGNGIWRIDAAGSAANVWSGSAGDLAAVGDALYFVSSASGNQSVFRSNGEVGGTVRLEPAGGDRYTNPYELTPVATPAGSLVFFRAVGFGPGGTIDGTGQELWATDGTADGTRLVRDINVNESAEYPGYPGSSLPLQLTAAGSSLFFTAWEPEHGRELWKSDGTLEGTILVKDITDDTGTAQNFERFAKVQFRELVAVGSRLIFTTWSPDTGVELWASDGTGGGASVVRDIVPGDGSSYPADLTADGSTAFFSAWDPDHGRELWQTDGTEAGTSRVADVAPGPASSSPGQLSLTGGALFFSATEDAVGREMWRMPIPRVRIEPAPAAPEGGTATLVATGTDPDGNGLTFDWDMDGDGTYELASLGSPSATSSAAGLDGPSSRVVRVRATDAAGVAAFDETTVLIVNVAPVVDAGSSVTLNPGQALARQGAFSDPGPDVWTATVDYGDGSGPQDLPLSGKTFTLAHAYASPGTYTLQVRVQDDDGGSGTATVSVTVTVRSPEDAIRSLIADVERLLADGELRRGQAYSLIAPLQLALWSLQFPNGEAIAAVMLDIFVQEVEYYVRTGVPSPEEGNPLAKTARQVIAQLQAP
jgi:ELWxxDGT repeat protein